MNCLGNCVVRCLISVLPIASVAEPASAQSVVRDGALQPPFVNPQGQSLQWVQIPQIEKELEIVPEQKEALAKLRTETYDQVRTLWPAAGGGDLQERQKKYYEAVRTLSEETEKKIREILLPHQSRRLSQVVLQMKLAQSGYGSTQAIATGEVADELGITDEQRAQLKEKEQEVMKEMREKLQEFQKQLQEESRAKLLGVLTPAQRRTLDAMLGDKFQWQTQVVAPAGGAGSPSPAVPAPMPRIDQKLPAGNGSSKLPRLPDGD